MAPPSEKELREHFFAYLFGVDEGYVCIATQHPGDRTTFKQQFFSWPGQSKELSDFVAKEAKHKNLWFGVNLLSAPERTKQFCKSHNLVWSDLDTCSPKDVEPAPQCVIESSPGRFQAIWRLDETVDPFLAEKYSKKIAYKYQQNGADPSGWDLTQLLRVPYTFNFKYANGPKIVMQSAATNLCPVEIFEALEVPIPEADDPLDINIPTELPDHLGVIYKYQQILKSTAFSSLYDSDPPDGADWSKLLWRLTNILIEADMSREEAFSVLLHAKCNKYDRDGRPIRFLWREVVKADTQQRSLSIFKENEYRPLLMPILVPPEIKATLEPTFIDEYREWATAATDAVPDFHNLSAFMLLSIFVSGNTRLHTSYGTMVPNIWGLVLGDSTLTRKTTAMRMAMDFVAGIDRDLVLATDGSAEGILTGLSGRPNRVSIYFKDEVTGFFDSIQKKDYLAGMAETMTQLYDVPEFYNRRLRKEVIEIINPVFIFFGGGIKDKLYSLIQEEFILSGFIPRFVIVSGDADLSKIRRTGPPQITLVESKAKIQDQLADLYENYAGTHITNIGGQDISIPKEIVAELTEDAWLKYGEYEAAMVETAHASAIAMLALPTFERLSRSLLKMAILLAASRQTPNQESKIFVQPYDVMNAAVYVQEWGTYTIDLILNSGKTVLQRTIDKVKRSIARKPGVTRSEVARNHSFTKREMDEVVSTLLDRGEIRAEQVGRGMRLWVM